MMIKAVLCWLGLHRFTGWEEDKVAPPGFGRLRRHCKWCPRREAKD